MKNKQTYLLLLCFVFMSCEGMGIPSGGASPQTAFNLSNFLPYLLLTIYVAALCTLFDEKPDPRTRR